MHNWLINISSWKRILSLVLLLALLSLACGGSAGNDNNAASTSGGDVTGSGDTASTPSDSNDEATNVDFSTWIDDFSYVEPSGNDFVRYQVSVYERGGALQADIDVDGPGITWRMRADAVVEGSELQFYLNSYRSGNNEEAFEPGDLLFALEDDGQDLTTFWEAMEPEQAQSGDVQFRRGQVETQVPVDPPAPNEDQQAAAPSATATPIPTTPPRTAPTAPPEPTPITYAPLTMGGVTLAPGGSVDLDGNGVADLWSDSGGVASRSPEFNPGWSNYNRMTLETCLVEPYYPDMAWGPYENTPYCFMTDQGFIGKFVISSVTGNGSLDINYEVWDYAAADVPQGGNQPAFASNPLYEVSVGSQAYEQWGRPTAADGCNGPYNDLTPIKRFTLDVFLTNNSAAAVPANWAPTFITGKGELAVSCIWNSVAVQPGQTQPNRFATHIELDDWVAVMIVGSDGTEVYTCFDQSGNIIGCEW